MRYNTYFPNDSLVLENLFKISYIYEYTNHNLEAIESYRKIRNKDNRQASYATFK